jgi:integrase
MAVHKVQHSRGTSYEMTIKIDGRVVRRRFGTAKQAHDAYAQLRQASNDGSYIPAERARITFDAHADCWIAGLVVRSSTLRQYRANLDRHLRPAFGPQPLERITRGDVQAFVRRLTDSHLAPATVRGIVNLLRIILKAAVDDGRLLKTPAVRITLPELPPKQLAVFTPDQVAALVDAARPDQRPMLLLALGTGLRQAELLGVTRDALDLDAGVLRVERQLLTDDVAGPPRLTPLLKTKASRRVLPLPRFALDALTEHLRAQVLDPVRNPEALVFVTGRGNPWRRSVLNAEWWKPLLHRAGLPSGFGMHALRHTYASTLIAEGLHPKVIQERLGHASITETMDTYSHLFPQAHAETAAALDRSFNRLQRTQRLRAV